jgi:hypothetical protein
MKRAMLIFLSLVLALAGWTATCADDGFYVISGVKRNYAPVPKTGQTATYATGDDGALQNGVAWPTPRFTDNNNGTVTDNLTKLIWIKNANFFGNRIWYNALSDAAGLAAPAAGLSDGSKAGDWRLPTIREIQSLSTYKFYNPALPKTLGTGKWAEGDPFQGVSWTSLYWSSTTYAPPPPPGGYEYAWTMNFRDGSLSSYAKLPGLGGSGLVWCVRGGQ